MLIKNLKTLKNRAGKEIKNAQGQEELKKVSDNYLGKKGELALILRSLKKASPKERVTLGKEANNLKKFLLEKTDERKFFLDKSFLSRSSGVKEKDREEIDVTVPGKKFVLGSLHPLTLVRKKTEEIFELMGFSVVEGPEIETEWYNFDALNILKNHPARDMWDTFWLCQREDQGERLLLRTHTSPVQVRYMEKHGLPLRIVVPGKIFRREATDASHEFQFYHLEGLMIDKGISVSNFRAIIQEFFQRFFQKTVKIRLRPSYFPFTEPSFEVDLNCLVCNSQGCSVCQKSGWLEIMGAGMVHPKVYKNSGLASKALTGFAFGIGLDRMAMMKYKINDIRLFHSGDLRFLKQF